MPGLQADRKIEEDVSFMFPSLYLSQLGETELSFYCIQKADKGGSLE